MSESFPIEGVMPEIIQAVVARKNVVLTAPTGSGKSTRVPRRLLESPALKKMIVVVQPRRLACRALAKFVAKQLGCEPGEEVGYQVRYESRVSASTRLLFMTDGVLLRHLESKQSLPWADVVIFDEFHERRALMDLSLAMLRRLQKRGAAPVVVAMSATLDHPALTDYLNAISLHSGVRAHPVEVTHEETNSCEEAIRLLPKWINHFHGRGGDGDVLVFLPGKREIYEAERLLKNERFHPEVAIVPLHGELSPEQQDIVFYPLSHRKVILATNVAETSLTIPGVRFVIDTGFERRAVFDPNFRVNRLNLGRVSRASADQRAGRAGREGPGQCIRLWSKASHERLPAQTPVEIQNTDLASVVMTLKSIGVSELASFKFLERPSPTQLDSAQSFLRQIGALDKDNDLTPIGWRMLRLPLSPRYARMVVESEQSGCLSEIATVAAIMCNPPLFPNNRWIPASSETASDFFGLIYLYHRFRVDRDDELQDWCEEQGINAAAFHEASLLRQKIIRIAFDRDSQLNRQAASVETVQRCLLAGLTDQIAVRQANGLYRLSNGMICRTAESVIDAPVVAAAEVRPTQRKNTGIDGVLSALTAVPPELILELAGQQLNPSTEEVPHPPPAPSVTPAPPKPAATLPQELQGRVTRLAPALRKLLG